MALIIEDGTGVADANSYATRDDLIAYAAARGVALPDTDKTDHLAIKAMDYLLTYGTRWKGAPVVADQPLAWPRTGHGMTPGIVPTRVINAQCELALLSHSGINLLPVFNNSEAAIVSEKVDVIETTYSANILGKLLDQGTPTFDVIEALLAPYLSAGFSLTVRRV